MTINIRVIENKFNSFKKKDPWVILYFTLINKINTKKKKCLVKKINIVRTLYTNLCELTIVNISVDKIFRKFM